jgi:hypothetical protein
MEYMGRDMAKRWGGFYAIKRGHITFNEGARPFNFTINWHNGLFVYVFLFGRRWSHLWGGRSAK